MKIDGLNINFRELAKLKPYLEENDFSGVYREITYFIDESEEISDYTKFFLECGIDPLEYMDEVPDCYADGLKDYDLSLPEHIIKVGMFAFSDAGLRTVNLENVEKLSELAFCYCEFLNTVKFGNYLQTIPNDCFKFCTSLKEVELPANIKTVRSMAFARCESLSHIIIHNPDCDIEFHPIIFSFKKCPKDMLVEVRSEKLANEFIEKGFKNVKIF